MLLEPPREVTLRASTCVHCGYDLAGTRVGEGLVISPECGELALEPRAVDAAAWCGSGLGLAQAMLALAAGVGAAVGLLALGMGMTSAVILAFGTGMGVFGALIWATARWLPLRRSK